MFIDILLLREWNIIFICVKYVELVLISDYGIEIMDWIRYSVY